MKAAHGKGNYEDMQLDEAALKTAQRKAGLLRRIAQVAAVQAKLDAVTEPFQNQRGRMVVITFKLETSRKGSLWESYYKKQLDAKKNEPVNFEMPDDSGKLARRKMKYDELEKTFNDLRDEKAKVVLVRAH